MNCRVLAADDDPLMRTLISVALRDYAEVVVAADGAEAFRLLKQEAFDLLFLDWDMPGRDGIETLEMIRQSGLRLPVIMVTARAKRDEVLRAIELGASDYIAKPFEGKVLLAKFKKWCPCPEDG